MPDHKKPLPHGRGSVETEARKLDGFVCIDHVAIAVRQGELEMHVNAYTALGFTEVHREDMLGADQVREVLLRVGDGHHYVQLLEPLSPDSPVARQIEKNGGRAGFAHLALRVRDIHAAFEQMKHSGYSILDAAPRPGSRGTTVFFVHPKTTEALALGYLMEIVQEGPHA